MQISFPKEININGISIILLFFALLFLPTTTYAGALSEPPNNLGLVGYWSMNDDGDSSTTATDFSGNGNDGTLTNMDAPTDWVNGRLNSALDFDGSDDYVKVGDPNSITEGDFTLSLWAKRPSGSSDTGSPSAFSQSIPSNWPNDLFILYVGDDKKTTNPGVRVYWDGGTALTYDKDLVDGQWHHYVLTRDSSTGDFELFVDGTSVKTANKSGTWTSSEMGIGAANDNGTWRQEMEGQIDEVRTYNRILSSSEVTDLYQTGFAKVNDSRELSSISGLKGWWPFDGENISGSTAEDASGNGNDGTINGASTTIGRMGQALDFDGSDDYVEISDSSSLDQSGDFTIATWVKGDSFSPRNWVLGKGQKNDANYGFTVESGPDLSFYMEQSGGTDIYCNTATVNTDQWYHIVGKYDASADEMTTYLDGSQVNTCTNSDIATNNEPLVFGKDPSNSTDYLDGQIDDPRVYDRALTSDEIQRLYNATRPDDVNTSQNDRLTDGLVGQWSFDGKNMDWTATNEARDTSGNGNHGNVTNFGKEGAAIGQIGQALDFDGSDDYVKVGDPNSITDGDFTLSLWAKRPSGSSDTTSPTAFSQNIPSNWTNDLFILYVGDNSGPTTNPGARVWWDGGNALTYDKDLVDGQWHHYVLTRDSSTGDFELFVDGTSVATGNKSGTWTSSEIGIGADNDNGTWKQEMEGQIDEVRTYDRILSSDEIQRLYNMGRK